MRFSNIAFHAIVAIVVLRLPSNVFGNERGNNLSRNDEFDDFIVAHECLQKCLSQGRHSLKCHIICGAERQKQERLARSIRSTTSPSTVGTEFSTEQAKNKYDCEAINYSEVYDTLFGVTNPLVTNMTIQYSRWQNKTRARIEWDISKECLKRDICRGYFLQWFFDYEEGRCLQIHDLKRKYFILNDTTGFDGIKTFAIRVIVFPSAITTYTIHFIQPPPPPGNITNLNTHLVQKSTSIIQKKTNSGSITNLNTHLVQKSTTIIQKKTNPGNITNFSTQKSTIIQQNKVKSGVQDGKTTFKVALGLFIALLLGISFLVIYYLYRRYKKKSDSIPIHRARFTRLIKGAHYISYLPATSTTSQVLTMYTWLASHHIYVIMDKMHDPKLYNSLGPKRFGEKFSAKSEKVIMIISPGYLELCWLDDTVELNSKTTLNSLDKERLYSEITYIKSELSTTINNAESRFIPVLLDVQEDDLPKWLNKITNVSWPKDGKSEKFLSILKGDSTV